MEFCLFQPGDIAILYNRICNFKITKQNSWISMQMLFIICFWQKSKEKNKEQRTFDTLIEQIHIELNAVFGWKNQYENTLWQFQFQGDDARITGTNRMLYVTSNYELVMCIQHSLMVNSVNFLKVIISESYHSKSIKPERGPASHLLIAYRHIHTFLREKS